MITISFLFVYYYNITTNAEVKNIQRFKMEGGLVSIRITERMI